MIEMSAKPDFNKIESFKLHSQQYPTGHRPTKTSTLNNAYAEEVLRHLNELDYPSYVKNKLIVEATFIQRFREAKERIRGAKFAPFCDCEDAKLPSLRKGKSLQKNNLSK